MHLSAASQYLLYPLKATNQVRCEHGVVGFVWELLSIIMLNSMAILFWNLMPWYLKVDGVEKGHLPVLENNGVPRSWMKPRHVDSYSILLGYLPLKSILGNAVYK